MKDRIRPSADWYRRNILSTGDTDFLIGPPFSVTEGSRAQGEPLLAFGSLVRLERRNRKLTVSALAQAIDVDDEEIRNIEHNPQYRARPRTILGISKHFGLPAKEVMKLAGAAASNDGRFNEKAMLFAAHSDDLGDLTKEEKDLLKSFVQFLRDNK